MKKPTVRRPESSYSMEGMGMMDRKPSRTNMPMMKKVKSKAKPKGKKR